MESIRSAFKEKLSYELTDEQSWELAEYGEAQVLDVIARCEGREIKEAFRYVLSILDKAKAKSAEFDDGSGKRETFHAIYSSVLEDGVITQDEYKLLFGAWMGNKVEDPEALFHIRFKVNKRRFPEDPYTWVGRSSLLGEWPYHLVMRCLRESISDGTPISSYDVLALARNRQLVEGEMERAKELSKQFKIEDGIEQFFPGIGEE